MRIILQLLDKVSISKNIELKNVEWNPLKSYLYSAKVQLVNELDEVEDVYTEQFGLRT